MFFAPFGKEYRGRLYGIIRTEGVLHYKRLYPMWIEAGTAKNPLTPALSHRERGANAAPPYGVSRSFF